MLTENDERQSPWWSYGTRLQTQAAAAVSVLRQRLMPHWVPLLAAAAVLAALVLAGKLTPLAGLVLWALVVLATVFRPLDDDEHALGRGAAWTDSVGRRSSSEQSLWRAVIDAIPTAAVALDAQAMVLHQNSLVADLFPKIRTGQPLSHAMRHPELIDAVDRALGAAEPISVDFIERVPIERHISAVISKLERAGPAIKTPALLVTFRDLTEQDRLSQMRADFIANASHELRTPLASLRGFVETLQGPAREDSKARERFLTLMASQASRMTRLIDDLLSLSRVEMRAHLPPRGIVELGEVAAYVAQTLEPLAEANRTAMTVERLDEPARIRGDRDEIVQVLQNLVHNAIKYGRTGGRVEVKVSRRGVEQSSPRWFSVSVKDDGPGIAPEHLPRLTERFYRANPNQTREKGGTGLGLAIVKHIVARHHGELSIYSRPGEGSTFTVTFEELGK